MLQAHQQQVIHAPTVVTGGAVVHIPAAGNSKDAITCRVLLLDGSDVNVELLVSALWSYDRTCGSKEKSRRFVCLKVVYNGKVRLRQPVVTVAVWYCGFPCPGS